MRRHIWQLFIVLILAACSRKEPTPTSPPSPTLPASPTPIPLATSTPPRGSPMQRITLVPSATRLPSTPQPAPTETSALPTSASVVELPSTQVPTSTATPKTVEAGATETATATATAIATVTATSEFSDAGATATATQAPTPTLPESPLPSPMPESTAAPSPEATSPPDTPTVSPLPAGATPTPTASPTPVDGTPTDTSAPTPEGEAWGIENLYTFYDDDFLEFYIWGEVVNTSSDHQRITTLEPIVYDADGEPIDLADTIFSPPDFDELMEAVSLDPEQSLAFSFVVLLPDEVIFEEDYDIVVETEPAEPSRDDLTILFDEYDLSDWPFFFLVQGTFDNPGADLTEYIALVLTVYDINGHVIGVGWLRESTPPYLTAGEHSFEIEVELFDIVDWLELEMETYKIQLFGY